MQKRGDSMKRFLMLFAGLLLGGYGLGMAGMSAQAQCPAPLQGAISEQTAVATPASRQNTHQIFYKGSLLRFEFPTPEGSMDELGRVMVPAMRLPELLTGPDPESANAAYIDSQGVIHLIHQ